MSTELVLKVVIIGDSGVGKTCIAVRYLTGEFTSQTRPTIAAGFCNAKVKLGATLVDLLIWDTAGHEAFQGMTTQYYRDAKIALIVFDVTNEKSLNSVSRWLDNLTEANPNEILIILIGNKIDCDNRIVSYEQGEQMAVKMGAIYRETSALTGAGISEIFEDSCEIFIKKFVSKQFLQTPGVVLKEETKNEEDLSSKCC